MINRKSDNIVFFADRDFHEKFLFSSVISVIFTCSNNIILSTTNHRRRNNLLTMGDQEIAVQETKHKMNVLSRVAPVHRARGV